MSKKNPKIFSKRKPEQKKRWLSLATALGGVLIIGVAFLVWRDLLADEGPVEVSGAPSLKVDQELVDLGDVKYNQPVQTSFRLTNVGDQTLQFTQDPYIEVVEGC